MSTHEPDFNSWDIDKAISWCSEAGWEPTSKPEVGAKRFESLSEEDLVNNARIQWTAEGIKKVRAFCAKHQVSTRNRPSPEQLLSLVDQICVLEDVTAFMNAAKKVLSCIDRYVSNKCPALDEEQQDDGEWKCVWYRFSEAWFQPGWDGDIKPPTAGDPWAERPVIDHRHTMGETRLINAAVEARTSRLRAVLASKMATAKSASENEESTVKAPVQITIQVPESAKASSAITNKESSPSAAGEAQTAVPAEKTMEIAAASTQYEIEEVLATYTGQDNQSFMTVKLKGLPVPVAVPVVGAATAPGTAQIGKNIKSKGANVLSKSGAAKQVSFDPKAAVSPETPSPKTCSFSRREPDAPKRPQAMNVEHDKSFIAQDKDAGGSETSERSDASNNDADETGTQATERNDVSYDQAGDSDGYQDSDASSTASLAAAYDGFVKNVVAAIQDGTDGKEENQQEFAMPEPLASKAKKTLTSAVSSYKKPAAPSFTKQPATSGPEAFSSSKKNTAPAPKKNTEPAPKEMDKPKPAPENSRHCSRRACRHQLPPCSPSARPRPLTTILKHFFDTTLFAYTPSLICRPG
ncbi:uncharacterized protein MYCFIDRAFT_200753 [Pseudocercospora fijiensis CIRAD86]|uniref:Uncharacterized protein n=1 Tax=Pseudocercospora fijiensis (strain CIRAD86) TaxID=383855 RepID=M3AHZ9_PSEFD|nr:uncharacterized protein MYCFIDRAFT_200753 [Pseudocercospora fijiensis CIRAD86]EME77132.1 hypothetical protein MYCFIDRAFT_200753 [Pseudocercospora fijiensis CIRAD86]